jgi:MFS family permease
LLTGTLYLALPHMPGLAAIALGFTISAVGIIMADIARNAWVADMSTAETTGRSYGVVELAAGVGATIGPLVGGLIYDVLGKDLVFYTNGVIMWLAAILVMLYVAKPEDGKTSG